MAKQGRDRRIRGRIRFFRVSSLNFYNDWLIDRAIGFITASCIDKLNDRFSAKFFLLAIASVNVSEDMQEDVAVFHNLSQVCTAQTGKFPWARLI